MLLLISTQLGERESQQDFSPSLLPSLGPSLQDRPYTAPYVVLLPWAQRRCKDGASEPLELPEMTCKLECLWKSVLVLQRQTIEGHKTMKLPLRVYPKMLKNHHSRHTTL